MYSVVLMAALTAGSAAPDCCWGGGWGGSSCGYSTYYGYAGYYGCSGSYGGYGSYGCWGGSYGCSGCYGGWGGCYGSSGCYGCYGCYGGYGCYGCYGGSSWYGSAYGSYGPVYSPVYSVTMPGPTTYSSTPSMPVAPVAPSVKMPPPAGDALPPPAPGKGGNDLSRAKVTIDVPALAKLYIDDQLMPDKAGKRTFVTPALRAGQTYFYDVKLVQMNDGQEQVQTTRVVLQPGQVVAATFSGANAVTVASTTNRP